MGEMQRPIIAALAAALCAATWAGCSCEDSEPAQGPVRAVRPAQQEAAEQAEAAPAEPAKGAAPQEERAIGESVLQAPADYLRTTTIRAPRHARKVVDTAFIQNEIYQFEAIHGRFPESLKELEQWRGSPLPEVPKGHSYGYDPSTGKLAVVPDQ